MRAWEEFLTQQERELGRETVEKWLRPLKITRFDACNLYLEAADSFKALWFEEHMRPKVQSKLFNNNNKQIRVHVAVSAAESQEKRPKKKRKAENASLALPPFSLDFEELDPAFQFETFISSQSNLLAYKILRESSGEEDSGLTFNPIYLFGRNGTGKTHLLSAAARGMRAHGKKAIYVRADRFTEHVVKAIRTGEMQTFRKAYRNVDALIIDDIEIFSRKNATQEEFFHTFNTLHVEGKQIILSGNCPPQELKYIEPRLISRFEWGIIVPLQMLEKEKLKEVLLQKSQKVDFPLSESIFNFLLDTFSGSLKALIRAFEALVLRTHLHQSGALTIEGVQKILSDLIQEEEQAVLTPGKIIRTVAEYYGIRMDDILSKSQARECALPRQIAMHLCRDKLHLPFMKIGDLFARDHSTVMASVKQVQKGIESKNHEITGSVRGIVQLLET